jgi:hypothetical protein
MKKILSITLSIAMMGVSATTIMAAPFNANNPNIVANYPTGPHGIVGEPEYHEGADVVMLAGQSGIVQQWFVGNSSVDGFHGDHSVWKPTSDTTCQSGSVLVLNAYPDWGDYLIPGSNYCVTTNDFLNGNQ